MEERQTCDLAGIWRFEIDKEDRGFAEHWEKRRLTQTITLPGCLQAQGYGDAISEDTPWVQSLYDALWYQRGEYVYAQEKGAIFESAAAPLYRKGVVSEDNFCA